MGGVGSFMRQNRTVYVGRIHVTDDIEEVVARHFAEWGQVERSKYICLAIIKYTTNKSQYEFSIPEVWLSSHMQTNRTHNSLRRLWHINHWTIAKF